MVELANEISNWGGIILSAALPVLLIYYFKVIEKRRNTKELKVAAELKAHDEKVAQDLKLASIDIAKDLKKASETIATELQIHIDSKIASINASIVDLGKRIDLVNSAQTEISKRVDSVSANQLKTRSDQLELIHDLQKRADMTNGNVENIRNDIMDVQETVEDISDGLYELPPLNSRKAERRSKRKRIFGDANYQGDFKRNIGSR